MAFVKGARGLQVRLEQLLVAFIGASGPHSCPSAESGRVNW